MSAGVCAAERKLADPAHGLPVQLVADGGDRLLNEHGHRNHPDDQTQEEGNEGDHDEVV